MRKVFFSGIPIELFIVTFFLCIFVFRFLVLLICNWFSVDFEYKIRNYITEKLYSIYILSPFEKFYNFNSAILVKNINNEVAIYSAAIGASLILINEILVFSGILFLLIYFQPKITAVIFVILVLFGFLINKFTKKQLNIWGRDSQSYEGQRVKHFFQTFNAIKEIKIFNKENFFIKQSKKFNDLFFDANKKEIFVRSLPRIFLELILILGLSIFFITIIISKKNLEEFLPIAVLFGAAGYRMLPSINRILTSLQKLRFANAVIVNINKQLDKKNDQILNSKEKLITVKFQSKIKLKDVNFSYPGTSKKIFEKLNIVIERNESIGISGESGSGKSTFINLITGLINCTSGDIEIDQNKFNKINKKDFQKQIGYVPQQTFLLDETILNNIAFGINKGKYNEEKLNRILHIVELTKLIKSLDKGIETMVGERGAKLSGGQIQRIGIARALYIDPKILILDEATNALDIDTEKKILQNINLNYKDIVKIVIAHRGSSFQTCDKIYKINNNRFDLINGK